MKPLRPNGSDLSRRARGDPGEPPSPLSPPIGGRGRGEAGNQTPKSATERAPAMSQGAEVVPFNPKPTPPPARRDLLEYIRDSAQRQLDELDQQRKDRTR